MPTKREKDEISGQETTGHEWDGIRELDTPLPKWWQYVFYATIVWAFAYYVFYPALPHVGGILGYSQRAEIETQMSQEAARRAPMLDRIRSASLDDIRKSPDLFNFAVGGGRSVFGENCAPCHGAGGSGAKGYPNLVDDDWLWGGTLDQIHRSVAFGVRNANEQSHTSVMPRFGVDGILNPAQINDVAEYVLAFTRRSTDAAAAGRGAAVFAEHCASCHGPNGEGNIEVGSKRLDNNIWLYGGDKKTIVETITAARNGTMPAWSERLEPAIVKMLAVYVHSLGGGR